jgi:hypothetical protein
VTYIGKLAYKDEINEGEHDPIVTPDVWQIDPEEVPGFLDSEPHGALGPDYRLGLYC